MANVELLQNQNREKNWPDSYAEDDVEQSNAQRGDTVRLAYCSSTFIEWLSGIGVAHW